MNESIDILATTNPAYCSLVLRAFAKSYIEAAESEPEYPLAFFALPTILSSTISRTFQGTNSKTGLLSWINKNPEVRIELPAVVKRSVPIVRSALVFGLQTKVFELSSAGTIRLIADRFPKEPKDPSNIASTCRHFSLAKSLGTWCGKIHSTSTVFIAIGITP